MVVIREREENGKAIVQTEDFKYLGTDIETNEKIKAAKRNIGRHEIDSFLINLQASVILYLEIMGINRRTKE